MNKKVFHIFGHILLALLLMSLVACNNGSDSGDMDMDGDSGMDMDHDDDMEHGHDDDEALQTVPNNGSVVRILAPADGDTFAAADEFVVEVETENFELGEEGRHWHIFIDGSSWGMVMGQNTDQVLRNLNLEPGMHEISVRLSIDTHEELEDGDSVMITITE